MERIICGLLALYGAVMLMMCSLQYYTVFKNNEKPKNKVHFYVARDKSDYLYLHVGKPFRDGIEFSNRLDLFFRLRSKDFETLGLNENDYANLKWEDEPVEVFLNLED